MKLNLYLRSTVGGRIVDDTKKSGLVCPRCGNKMVVRSTVKGEKVLNRYRACTSCNCKIYTEEKALRVTSQETFE